MHGSGAQCIDVLLPVVGDVFSRASGTSIQRFGYILPCVEDGGPSTGINALAAHDLTTSLRAEQEPSVSPKRVILRAELTPQAKTGLEHVCDARGMTQVSVMSRLVLWFAQQPDHVQKAVLEERGQEVSEALMRDLMRRLEGA